MKILLAICMMSLTSCNRDNSNHSTSKNAEAESIVLKMYKDWYTKCGDDYFEYKCFPGPENIDVCIYYQYKGVKVLINEDPLNPSDKLNEVTWRGKFVIDYEFYRFTENEKWGNWSGAASNLGEGQLRIENGFWNYKNMGGSNKIQSCETIPK